jgi:pimeloyl-ACP methyl ester carboxylesterase
VIPGVGAVTGGRDLDRGLPLIVFVHGAGMDRTVWQLVTRYFANHGYSVLAVDLPGHGGTPGPAPDSIGGYRSWLVDVIDRSGFGGAHIVGHSMGGLIGLAAAATRPDLVRSLTMLGVSARLQVHRDLLDAAKREDHLAFELVASWSHARRAHAGGHPTPGLWLLGSTLRLLERGEPGVLYNDLAACDAYEGGVEAAAKVTCETLFLLGGEDVMANPAGAVPLIEATSWSRTITLPGTGHMSMVERPDDVIDALAGFLTAVERPPS